MSVPYVELRGTGPDLVLLHGWALHGGMWGPWLDRLETRFRLHLVDLPGHGRSPWPAGTRQLADLARAIAPVVPAGSVVLGWSLGGMVALELARLRPTLAALVLIATTPCFLKRDDWAGGMEPAVLQGFAAGLAGNHRRTIANFLALQAWGDERATEALRSLRANLGTHGEPDPLALAAGLEILREADLREGLPRLGVPALVIAGEHDRITPPGAGRELAARLPSARFREIAKAGHAPFLSHPDAVLAEVEDFLGFLAAPPVGADPGREEPSLQSAPTHPPGATIAPAVKDAFALDVGRVRHSFSIAARAYDAAAVLQKRVRDELLGRLDLLTMRPQAVLDLGAGTGHAAAALRRRYPDSRVVALDLAPGMLLEAGRQQTLFKRFDRVAADAASLPLRDGALDMVLSSLMLQWCNDPDRVLRECRRVLRPGGVLHFATFGPDTLIELRRAWQAADPAHAHVSRFIDMHDLGDALVRAGFAEPVLDVERYTLTYHDARDLMRELKTLGAHNATAGRARGLTGKRTLHRMLEAYESCRRDGKLPATYEVVYAQAWAPEAPLRTRTSRAAAEAVVPLSRLGRGRPDGT
ncbi:MAG TPA: pimeloyl-ACP methyl ester esterase BioH [Steroidobacteraceae bacterium]|nr:pimeloyl-ACP methyl ester esterase BioH [Steroidobacteraceae bacterium]